MADILDFGKLFNFGDQSKINETIENLTRLIATLEDVQKVSAATAADYTHALNDIAKSAEKLDGEMDDLDATLEDHQKLIVQSAEQAEKLIRSQEQTTKALEAERIAAEQLKAAEDALADAKKKLGEET